MQQQTSTVRLIGSSLLTVILTAVPLRFVHAEGAGTGAAGGNVLEEITVTAQRRNESIQSVPIAITAVTANSLRQANITSTADLPMIAPSVTFQQSVGGAAIQIRGIGSTGTAGDESANAVYVDGVYQAALPTLIMAINNIERIEVLKGPQGTLFGRNASGGVIQVITKDPAVTPHVDASIGYGNYNTFQGMFYGTTGITQNLAADLAVYDETMSSGWGTNLATGRQAYEGRNFSARTKWRWEVDSDTDLTVIGSYNEVKPAALQGITVIPGELNKAHLGSVGFYNEANNLDNFYDTKQATVSANISHDLGWARIVNVSSYDHATTYQTYDQDASTLPLINTYFSRTARTLTDELQLLSPAQQRIKWIGGYFYYNNQQAADPLRLTGAAIAPATFSNLFANQKTESHALYAQTTLPIVADSTHVTLGARYTHDTHHFLTHTNTSIASGLLNFDEQHSDGKFTYRAAVDQRLSADVLAYVSYATGFKSGLYNITAAANPVVLPQTITDYEVGLKSDWFGRRLRINAAYFYDTLNNIQLRANVAGSTFLYNAAAGRMRGVDLDFAAQPLEGFTLQGGLTFLDGIYTRFPGAPFFTISPAGGLVQTSFDASGKAMLDAPRWAYSIGGSYLLSTKAGEFTAAVNLNHNGGFFYDPQNRVREPLYNLLNASVKWQPSQRWDLTLWGKNLLNEKYFAQTNQVTVADVYYAAAPLTYGASVEVHF